MVVGGATPSLSFGMGTTSYNGHPTFGLMLTVSIRPSFSLPSRRRHPCLGFWEGPQLVLETEIAALTTPFSEEEVWAAIKGMNSSSAPGPDGLPVKFFQVFWNTIKGEVKAMFEEFYVGMLDLNRLNYGVITLLPKVPGASDIRQFHPIMVINVIFRILA